MTGPEGKEEVMKDLRCRDGDLAVITRDEPGLEANVGRLLWVYGPVLGHPELGPVWETLPATDEPMPFLDEAGAIRSERTNTFVIHPDAWMTPVQVSGLVGKRPPPRFIEPVPLTREWLEAVMSSPERQVYLQLPRRDGPDTPSLTGAELRSRLQIEVCVPVQEDYGCYAAWLWFPGRSLSATAHWWVHEGTPELIGQVFRPADDAARAVYEQLTEDKRLPWVFADGDWNTLMVLPARFEANLVPCFARGRFDVSEGGAIKRRRRGKQGGVFGRIEDYDRRRANWRISEAIAAESDPETFLDDLLRALRDGESPLPVLHG